MKTPDRGRKARAPNGPKRRPPRPRRLATLSPVSDNRKTGPICVTYVAEVTCPGDCPLAGECYGRNGHLGGHWARLNEDAAALGATALDAAREEAALIRACPALSDLRLHVVGDCPDDECAREVSGAAEEYMARGAAAEVVAFTYTHAWRTVARASWGGVSVLASCETPFDLLAARGLNYAAALVVPEFTSDRAYPIALPDGSSTTLVPCPYQTRGVQCVRCRLCMDADRLLRDNLVIGFAAHGARRKSLVRTLDVLNTF